MKSPWDHIPTNDHPACFSANLFPVLVEALRGQRSVIDPMAGVGRIHAIAEAAGVLMSVGIEIEPEWANRELFTGEFSDDTLNGRAPWREQLVGDSREILPDFKGIFSSACWSPDYGNRMSDRHEAKDACKPCAGSGFDPLSPPSTLQFCKRCKGTGLSRRNTYRHRLGRPLSEGNVVRPFGQAYKELHSEIYRATMASIDMQAPDPLIVVNVKDFLILGERQEVTAWHIELFEQHDWKLTEHHKVHCNGNRNGANGDNRIDYESVLEFRPE